MPIVFSDVAAASLRAATPSVCERPDGRTVEVIAKFSGGCEENETSLAREVIEVFTRTHRIRDEAPTTEAAAYVV
jgi:hypothetical protein